MRIRIIFYIAAIFTTLQARAAQPVSELEVRFLPIGAMLTWQCQDMDVTGFTIERSVDGFTFELLSRVVAEKGEAASYNYLDTDRPDNKHYYRITSFDRSGSSAHSPLAEAPRPGTSTWHLNGNFSVDVSERFDFEVESNAVEMLACDLYDFVGNPVSKAELLVTPGPNGLSIETADIAPGAYKLNVSGGEINEVIHFVKVAKDQPESPLVRGN